MERWWPVLPGLAGVGILAGFAVDRWSVRPVIVTLTVLLVLASVTLLFGKSAPAAGAHIGSGALALGALLGPYIGIRLLGEPVAGWEDIYIVGAVGGLVLELTTSRGRIELPGPGESSDDDKDDPRRPLGLQADLGFCARMLLGGLAAVVALGLIAAADAEDATAALAEAAAAPLSLIWALAIGAASTAVWSNIQRLAEARLGLGGLQHTVATLAPALADIVQKLEELGRRPAEPGKAEGALLSESALEDVITRALNTDQHQIDVAVYAKQLVDQVEAETPVPAGILTKPGELAGLAGALHTIRAQLEAVSSQRFSGTMPTVR